MTDHAPILRAWLDFGPSPELNTALATCPDMECPDCSLIVCPSANPLHFHHDGCPSCEKDAQDREGLQPCPFCGGDAEIIRRSVHCNNPSCEAQPFTSGQTVDEAIAGWNRRPQAAKAPQ